MTVVTTRIQQELLLLMSRWPDLEYVEDGHWIRIPRYPIANEPLGWSRTDTDVAIQIHGAHPGQPPYGLYVPTGIRFNGQMPTHYQEPAPNRPPFNGDWGVFSWTVDDWTPAAEIHAGSNLLNVVAGFGHRFQEGA